MIPSSQGKIRRKGQWKGEVTKTYRSESGIRARGATEILQISKKGSQVPFGSLESTLIQPCQSGVTVVETADLDRERA